MQSEQTVAVNGGSFARRQTAHSKHCRQTQYINTHGIAHTQKREEVSGVGKTQRLNKSHEESGRLLRYHTLTRCTWATIKWYFDISMHILHQFIATPFQLSLHRLPSYSYYDFILELEPEVRNSTRSAVRSHTFFHYDNDGDSR